MGLHRSALLAGRAVVVIAATLLLAAEPVRAVATIRDVRLIHYKIERTRKLISANVSSEYCYGIFVLVTARCDDGKEFTALGDILPRNTVTYETTADALAGAQIMRIVLLGKQVPGASVEGDAKAIRSIMEELRTVAARQRLTTRRPPSPERQLRATLCGFDVALVDLVGQLHGVPSYEVLGGRKRQCVKIAAPTFNADETAEELADKVEEANDAYQAMRVKIGLDDNADVERIRAIAKALRAKGETVSELWVDANQAWKTSERSVALLWRIREALKDAGFASRFIIEQPTIGADLEALASVTRATRKWNDQPDATFKIVTCADEAVWDIDDLKKLVQLQAADVVNIKIQKTGGLLAAMDAVNYLADASPDTGVYIGGVISTDVTAWANLQLAYAVPRLDYATGCIPRRAYPENIATIPVQYEFPAVDGERQRKTLKSPTRAGLGTFIDLDRLQRYVVHDSATQPSGAHR